MKNKSWRATALKRNGNRRILPTCDHGNNSLTCPWCEMEDLVEEAIYRGCIVVAPTERQAIN